MNLQIKIENAWLLFTIAFGLMLFATYVMNRLAKNFCTKDVLVRRFSIMDLEFASTNQEIVNIMRGLFLLPEDQSRKAIGSLRAHFWVDYLVFMPATYGGIFILAMKVSEKMGHIGHVLFPILAWLQIVAFMLDFIENWYLMKKIRQDANPSPAEHRRFKWLEIFKWGIALLAAICSFSAVLYYWLSGNFMRQSLWFLGLIAVETILYLGMLIFDYFKTKKENKPSVPSQSGS